MTTSVPQIIIRVGERGRFVGAVDAQGRELAVTVRVVSDVPSAPAGDASEESQQTPRMKLPAPRMTAPCSVCGKHYEIVYPCSVCKKIYCGALCQAHDWEVGNHRMACRRV